MIIRSNHVYAKTNAILAAHKNSQVRGLTVVLLGFAALLCIGPILDSVAATLPDWNKEWEGPYDWEYDIYHEITPNFNLREGQFYGGNWNWDVQSFALRDECTSPSPPNPQNDSGNRPFSFGPPMPDASPLKVTKRISAQGCAPTRAEANAQFGADQNGVFFHRLKGGTTIGPPPNRVAHSLARSNSVLQIQIGTENQRGPVRWRPAWRTASISSLVTKRRQVRDPLDITWTDLDTGEILTDRLWDAELVLDGPGESALGDGLLTLANAEDGSLRIDMDSPYLVSGGGSLYLEFHDGVVTESTSTGIWADATLPAIGASPDFSVQFGDATGELILDVDYGGSSAAGYDAELTIHSVGLAELMAVPEPATALLATIGMLLGFRRRRAAVGGLKQRGEPRAVR